MITRILLLREADYMALTLVSGTSRNGRRKGTANPNSYERAILRIGQAIPERVKLSMEHAGLQ